jgi:DNA-directed RNA polymerase specialized sigma24 family protein
VSDRRLHSALARLTPIEREAIVLRLERGCGHDEIARTLARPSREAVRMFVRRSLLRLAAVLDG